MVEEKLNKSIKNIDIHVQIDKDIEKYIQEFRIDKDKIEEIYIPCDIKKIASKPFKDVKKEKRKNIRYTILDAAIVIIILTPIVGLINPNIFKSMPNVYPVFSKINESLQIDNLKSILGIGDDKEVIEGSIDSSVNTIYISEEEITEPKTNNESIKLIHSLANTLVEAEYKWQCGEVTPKTIETALSGVDKIKDSYDRMHLRNSLTKWIKGDFSNAVEVHNYVWEMLDGSVGKATSLDREEINKVINNYFK